jgi:hypothetical protein
MPFKSNGLGHTSNYDARSDLGYGRSSAKFDLPRSFVQYGEIERDPEAEEYIKDETYEAILTKVLDYDPGDPYAKYKNDPFHFVDGSTKISELSTAKGMVPFPRMYKSRTGSGTGGSGKAIASPGPTNTFRSISRPTGTKKGYSSAPEPIEILQDLNGPKYSLKDIMFGDEDLEHLETIQNQVFKIHNSHE